MMSGRVVVIGSVNLDTSTQVAAIPGPGETVLASALERSGGGKGANQALAAARAGGAHTTLIARVGDDNHGRSLRHKLVVADVAVHFQLVPQAPTGQAFVTVAESGENSIVVVPGANKVMIPFSIAERSDLSEADVVLLQLETPSAYITQARAAMRESATLILNAAPVVPLTDAEWSAVDLLIVNQHEARELTGVVDPAAALATLASRVTQVIITLGAKGSLHAGPGVASVLTPAFATSVADTTGAGDTFCGVVAAELAQRATIGSAIRRATAAAAISVTRRGAQTSIPTSAEIDTFLGPF